MTISEVERERLVFTDSPDPSQELCYVARAKARVSWLLEWRALREAGFTEQRIPPASGSGWITEWRALREAGFTEQRIPPASGSGWITGRIRLGPI
ncbi:hypothetical protein ISN44_As10g003430 [Arabidopsis suecica]|uniref:Uncharacterized protein n=1 Tax=Arabidopsis suecica TaxID=45249 RepID=A0A8T1ZVQ7_ARASU|nr:hypothetical protein ISN44_As10g003430 [Arabidopsis suecica]